jgi:hypothetical protein
MQQYLGWLLAMQHVLHALTTMVVQEEVDMYTAWSVVHRRFPKMPDALAARARWLLILSTGATDAEVHAEQAKAVVDLLWGAVSHSDAATSAAAAAALAQWPIATLEALELEWPLSHWSQVRVASPALAAYAQSMSARCKLCRLRCCTTLQ